MSHGLIVSATLQDGMVRGGGLWGSAATTTGRGVVNRVCRGVAGQEIGTQRYKRQGAEYKVRLTELREPR